MERKTKRLLGIGLVISALSIAPLREYLPEIALLGPANAAYLRSAGPPLEADQRTFTSKAKECCMYYTHNGSDRHYIYDADHPEVKNVSDKKQIKLWKRFNNADTNQDGKISYTELM